VILAGIDEAGYGPRLGPLCAGAAIFLAPGAASAAAVDRAVAAAAAEAGVAVDDSKRVHRPGAGTRALEETVLPFAHAALPSRPASAGALLAALGVGPTAAGHPWYASVAARPVPDAADAEEVGRRARDLERALARRGVRAILAARVLPEGAYNLRVAASGNKAAVLFDEVAALLARAVGAPPRGEGEAVEVLCDRQGGRAAYGPLLQSRFPDRLAVPVREGREVSAYDLRGAGPPVRVRFEVDADARSAAVALASCTAKLLREWHMAALNRFVLAGEPGVRPTAGYWTDGTRFLRETGGARRRLGIDDAVFVRSR
jgi:ribonuclease HII